MNNYYEQEVSDITAKLESDLDRGLSTAQATLRLQTSGYNRLEEKRGKSYLFIFLGQFSGFLIIILMAAAIISGLLQEWSDAIAILTIMLLNALLGASQEIRAEKAVAALKKLSTPQITLLRDGNLSKIGSESIVPGDIVILEAGAFVPADLRLIESVNLKIDESALTGESETVDKQSEIIKGDNLPLGDQKNLAFSGTMTTYGRGKGLVVTTGMRTELGKIANLIAAEEKGKTPLEKKFDQFGRWLGYTAIGICAVIFLVGLLFHKASLTTMFLTAVSLAVAAVPESLPAVVTISLALGAYRLVKRRAIIRKLPAVETLGSVTIICSDKTGTLTENKMTVEVIEPFADRQALLIGAVLCSDATLTQGDPTEIALVAAAAKEKLQKTALDADHPRALEIPFDSKTKRMTTLHKISSGHYVSYTKGAIEVILSLCVNLSDADKEKILSRAAQLARSGKRLIGVASKEYDLQPTAPEENALNYLGFFGMADPLRPEVKAAVQHCYEAGITPIMITGDHRLTALAIAKEAGIAAAPELVLEGQEIDQRNLSSADLLSYRVFARVSPEHKLKIVTAFKQHGEVVAMTGDGVNDAPALKASDIGVAMGISGTDVSKEAADMILTDDNFATIVGAIEAGRGIYDNLMKFVRYVLTTNAGEVLVMFSSVLLGFPLPLLPIQILWVNLVTDGLPALALTMEPLEDDIMKRPPRRPDAAITDRGLFLSMLGIGLLMTVVTLSLFLFGLNESLAKARTLAFTSLALLQMTHVLNCKSDQQSLFKVGLFSNRYLIWAITSTFFLQWLVVSVPFLQAIFHTTTLSLAEWILVLLGAATAILAVELRKWRFSPKT
ncbi:calcium-translocating P-type ATPase, PMCA-type [Candidatus Saganbacteria bacterium]|nr:calcium-translocating P-type ATPase, PMCA-type [Candidatus Saganbacteria bacterium]